MTFHIFPALMGDYDGDPNNDLKYKNGTPITDASDDREIFYLARTCRLILTSFYLSFSYIFLPQSPVQ